MNSLERVAGGEGSRVGWRTSVGVGGKAHFYDVTGAVACGDRKGIWPGARLADLFTRPTRATMDEDHICFYCAEKHERTCLCWTCQARRRAKVLAKARKKEPRR